ncbi:hypothetical protein GCM10027610_050300 [Dactylosporangium cerinum]
MSASGPTSRIDMYRNAVSTARYPSVPASNSVNGRRADATAPRSSTVPTPTSNTTSPTLNSTEPSRSGSNRCPPDNAGPSTRYHISIRPAPSTVVTSMTSFHRARRSIGPAPKDSSAASRIGTIDVRATTATTIGGPHDLSPVVNTMENPMPPATSIASAAAISQNGRRCARVSPRRVAARTW